MDRWINGYMGWWLGGLNGMLIATNQFTKQSITPNLVQNEAATRTFFPGMNRFPVTLSTCRKNASNSSLVMP